MVLIEKKWFLKYFGVLITIVLLNSCDYKKVSHSHEVQKIQADSLYGVGNLIDAKVLYKQIWDCCKERDVSYQLAKSHALTAKKDSAYYYLNYALEGDTGLYRLFSGEFIRLLNDSDFDNIINEQLRKYQIQQGEFLQPGIARELYLAKIKDGAYYYHLSAYPDSVKKYEELKRNLNRENLEMLDELVGSHGWPSVSEVGFEVLPSAFFIIQHADSVQTIQRYLPYIERAVDQGDLDKYFLAYMMDKIDYRLGEYQQFGTQMSYDSLNALYYLHKVVEPVNLNKRRAEMNLEPIEDYVKRFENAELRIYE